MASRNTDGSLKTQPKVTKSVRHNGGRLVIGDSSNDTTDSREANTSVRA